MDGVTPFSHRADAYAATRPPYPANAIGLVRDRAHLEPGARVADVGSGTGILTRQLLETGATIYAVEPNAAMRAQAEAALGDKEGFVSLDGRAEELPFDDSTLDLVVCGQSFHWFDGAKAMEEFNRVLHGAGLVALLWNSLHQKDPFTAAFQEILTEANTDSVGRSKLPRFLFAQMDYTERKFAQRQELMEWELVNLARSRSYWPDPESDLGRSLEQRVAALAKQFSVQSRVTVHYLCEVCIGFPA